MSIERLPLNGKVKRGKIRGPVATGHSSAYLTLDRSTGSNGKQHGPAVYSPAIEAFLAKTGMFYGITTFAADKGKRSKDRAQRYDVFRLRLTKRHTLASIRAELDLLGIGHWALAFKPIGNVVGCAGSGPAVNASKRNASITRERVRVQEQAGFPAELLVAIFGESTMIPPATVREDSLIPFDDFGLRPIGQWDKLCAKFDRFPLVYNYVGRFLPDKDYLVQYWIEETLAPHVAYTGASPTKKYNGGELGYWERPDTKKSESEMLQDSLLKKHIAEEWYGSDYHI
jgi:hypothetical protein